MKKRNAALILSMMLMVLLAAGSALANPVVDIGSGSGAACGQVVVPITLTNDGIISIAGVGIDIAYNSQYLTPTDATIGPAAQAAGKGIAKNIVSPGLYRVLVFSTSNMNIIGNGIIAYVTFGIDCAAPATTYTLGNTPSSSTPEGLEVPTDGSDGTIQVGQAITTTTTVAVRPPEDHIVSCLVCHAAAIHTPATHTSDCSVCHLNNNSANIPEPGNCIVCHPIGNIGTCNLVNFHDPGKSTTCLTCHVDCNAPTTDDHIKQCLVCHPTDFSSTSSLRLHSRSGHSTCGQCHAGTPGQGNVTADKCSVCHPLGNTGECKIVDLHSPNIISTCLTCHMNCAGGGAATTTTTTASGSTTTTTTGGSTTTTTASGTTTIPTEHYSVCRTCHYTDDVHAVSSHNVCANCHSGAPAVGTVSASKCIVCHPNGDPGECNLVKYHGNNTCTGCHTDAMCANPSGSHTDLCLTCHYVNDIHAKPAHQNCAICHASVPKKGNVSPGDCVVCHPLSQPGKCNLIQDSNHTNNCSTCHITCTGGNTSTTTTTTLPPGSCEILRISPVNGVKIGFGLLPRIARITVTTNTDLKSIGIIDCDFKFENHPRGIHILHAKVVGSAIEATVLFVAVQPGPYTILLGECGSTSITISRFWEFPGGSAGYLKSN